jgi:hypothetical protein
MAVFPKEGKYIEIGHELNQLAGPVSLLRAVIKPGPGPQQVQRQIDCRSGKPERPVCNLQATCMQIVGAQ